MTKYPEIQMDDPIIKVCGAKATWNKKDEVFRSHELTKQICVNRYGNEVNLLVLTNLAWNEKRPLLIFLRDECVPCNPNLSWSESFSFVR
jgi:hypothetical protein